MNILVQNYRISKEREVNLEKALYWYQKAAENGKINAMDELASLYYNGEGTEKNLEKAFYWFQKAAENGKINAMDKLASLYYNGEGTEKNLEKAFYWYQKAAKNGEVDAMTVLASLFHNGEGTEKNLKKAFDWYQKAAENGKVNAMYILALSFYIGEETEKNLEKAFYWVQKAAEKDNANAISMLAGLFYNGEGTEKNLEKAFYWVHKAAENGIVNAMNNLALLYKNGEGTEKNLEKAFYWFQKAADNSKIDLDSNVNKLCKECNQLYIDYQWCQNCNSRRFQQNFLKWTSKNESIDKFIQDVQLNAKSSYEVLEWIPYNKLENINYYNKGGFSIIDKAIWLYGPIYSWNFDKQQWNRWTSHEVILKNLNNSSNLNDEFLNEWRYYYNCQKQSFSKFIRFFGITQDPKNLNYIIVMSRAKEGSLREYLPNVMKFNWYNKLQLLKKIILGLKIIHESDLIHCDLHDGNILISNNEALIIDLGLCKPMNELQNSKDIYGVLPYMAPELIRGKPYTKASDIYSLSMIMWEFTSGIPPFDNEAHDYHLGLSICEGKRPEIIKDTPKHYLDLMKACWDLDPFKRPTLEKLENILSEWLSCINDYYLVIEHINKNYSECDIDFMVECLFINRGLPSSDLKEFAKTSEALIQKQANISITQSHSQAYYKSQLLDFTKKLNETLEQEEVVLSSNSECLDCIITK